MATDMMKARAAIAVLKSDDSEIVGAEQGEHLRNLIDTFEWLDQSRTDAIEARENAQRTARLWQEDAERYAKNADFWRQRAEDAEAKIAAWAEASK